MQCVLKKTGQPKAEAPFSLSYYSAEVEGIFVTELSLVDREVQKWEGVSSCTFSVSLSVMAVGLSLQRAVINSLVPKHADIQTPRTLLGDRSFNGEKSAGFLSSVVNKCGHVC
jgi:hypothetical protein